MLIQKNISAYFTTHTLPFNGMKKAG